MPSSERDLPQELAATLTSARPTGVSAAWIFGSVAERRAHSESDLDVAFLLDRTHFPAARDRFDAGVRLAAWLAAELRHPRIDLVVLDDAPPTFAARIVTEGLCVYCADAEREHAFRRDSQLRAADLAPFLRRTRAIKLQSLDR